MVVSAAWVADMMFASGMLAFAAARVTSTRRFVMVSVPVFAAGKGSYSLIPLVGGDVGAWSVTGDGEV